MWSASGLTETQLQQRLRNLDFNYLALANPRLAPYGLAAEQVLENMGLLTASRSRWVLGENISQAYQFVISAHDAAWYFIRLGRNLERADMTTRLLDAGAAALLQMERDESTVNVEQLIWGNVLRSVGADQSYRRTTRSAVEGEDVVYYLLEDAQFPRTIAHCLNALADSAKKLPRSKELVDFLIKLQENIFDDIDYNNLGEPLREYLNDLQQDLASIHSAIARTWFPEV